MAFTCGHAVVFGVKEVRPITNVPSDALAVKIRLREANVGLAIVRFRDHTERWVLAPTGNDINAVTWELWIKQAENVRWVRGKGWASHANSGTKGDQGGCVIGSGGSAVCVKEKE